MRRPRSASDGPFASHPRDVSRRAFLRTATAATSALALGPFAPRRAHAAGVAAAYAGLDSSKWIDGEARIEVELKDEKIFTEGPAVDRRGLVYFSNVPAQKILTWDPAKKVLGTFRENSRETNGNYFDSDGSLLSCEGGAGRVVRTDMKTGKITVLADKYNGFAIPAPNDLCTDGKGRVYFTSRPGGDDPTKGNVNAVYRIDPDGKLVQLLAWPNTHMPNGIVTSPDDRILYVIEAHPDADRARNILAFDLDAAGNISGRRVLIDFYPGRSGDGMCIDAEGNLWVAAGLHAPRKTSETLDTKPGIHVVSPAGRLVAYAPTPVDTVTNCHFGGPDLRTLYVTCGPYLMSLRTKVPGKPAYRPNA